MDHLKLTLLTSSFVIPLILGITLFVVSDQNFPRKVMGFALLNAFFVFLANYLFFQQLFLQYSRIHSIHIATVLWIFPSIYLYIKSIVCEEKHFKKEFVHLVPGLLFGLTSAFLFYGLLSQEERIYYLSNYRSGVQFSEFNLKLVSVFRSADVVAIVLQVIYYSITFIRIPYKYNERLNEEYSNIENFSINWLKWFNASFVLIGILSIAFYMFNPFHEKNDFFLIIFLSAISAFIWIIGLWSFKQKKPECNLLASTNHVIEYHEETPIKDEALIKILIEYFENEKPFLLPDLTLTTVCKNIGTNRTYLSATINSKFGMNFNAFVNQFRTRHIEEYLRLHPQTPKEDLVYIGGFGSVSSLKRALNKTKLTD